MFIKLSSCSFFRAFLFAARAAAAAFASSGGGLCGEFVRSIFSWSTDGFIFFGAGLAPFDVCATGEKNDWSERFIGPGCVWGGGGGGLRNWRSEPTAVMALLGSVLARTSVWKVH